MVKSQKKTKSKNSLEGFKLTHITAMIAGKKTTWKVKDKYPYERKKSKPSFPFLLERKKSKGRK